MAEQLTPREREVLALMAAGKTNGDISRELRISFPTAKAHVSSILGKLGAESREDAVQRWNERSGRAWRRSAFAPLLLLGFAAAISLGAVVAIKVFWVDSNDIGRPSEIRVALDKLEPGIPYHAAVDGLGVSPYGTPYGLWLVRYENGVVLAFFDRDSHTGCPVPWNPGYDLGQLVGDSTVPKGAFKEPCGGWVYLITGQAVFGAPPRGLDTFPTEIVGDSVIVHLAMLQLGLCRQPESLPDCSTPESPKLVSDIPPPIIPNWGHRTPSATLSAATNP
jgi:DNA-binding CsgD family transcriptional regulator/Rieske Fe-S protein